MVLDTSLSLLPCRSTRRPSEASNQDVQRGMVGSNASCGRACADSIIHSVGFATRISSVAGEISWGN